MTGQVRDRLTEIRREFHRYPEPGWREFYTTHPLVAERRAHGVDELPIGPDAYDSGDRTAVPNAESVDDWCRLARERGADPELLDRMAGGHAGVGTVLDRVSGPHVGLRVDIDGLFVEESPDHSHVPVVESFRPETGETMDAYGHNVLTTWDPLPSTRFSGLTSSPNYWTHSTKVKRWRHVRPGTR